MQYLYNGWQQENKPNQNLISQILLVTSCFPSHSASYIVWFYVCMHCLCSLSHSSDISPEPDDLHGCILSSLIHCSVVGLIWSKPEDFYLVGLKNLDQASIKTHPLTLLGIPVSICILLSKSWYFLLLAFLSGFAWFEPWRPQQERGAESNSFYTLKVVAPFNYDDPLEFSKTPVSLNKDIGIPFCTTSELAFKVL